MDSSRFDALAKSLTHARTRRRGALVALLGGVLGNRGEAEADAKTGKKPSGGRSTDGGKKPRRDTGREARLHPVEADAKRKKKACPPCKRRKGGTCKKQQPDGTACPGGTCQGGRCQAGCTSQSMAQTCDGRCGSLKDNCGQAVDCGPCTCGVCPTCNICDPAIGRCEANPDFLGQDCGLPGQVCQQDGACACADNSCAAGQRCNGIVCLCDGTSCPNGCCDGTRTCHQDDDAACGTNGGICTRCGGSTTCCQGTCVPTCSGGNVLNPDTCQCECPGGQTECSGQCVNLQTDSWHCGTCATDCTVLPHVASATCAAGTCDLTCQSGWGNCTASTSDGCETQLGTVTDCAVCGDTCPASASCQGGACQCPGGSTLCNGTCVINCSGGKILNPTTCQCNDCPLGQTECSGQCVNLQDDENHCGSCTNTCGQDEICQSGACNFCVPGGCLRTCSGPASCLGGSGGCGSSRGCIGSASGHLVCAGNFVNNSSCSTDADCGGSGRVCATNVGGGFCAEYQNMCAFA